MATAVKSDPDLWNAIVKQVKAGEVGGTPGTWNARKAQLAVRRYKSRGGKYSSRRSRKNSLRQWTDEDWGYINDKPGNRYLPRKVRESLTPAEARTENRRKKTASRKGKSRAKYSSTVAEKLRRSRRSRRNSSKSRSRRSRRSRRK